MITTKNFKPLKRKVVSRKQGDACMQKVPHRGRTEKYYGKKRGITKSSSPNQSLRSAFTRSTSVEQVQSPCSIVVTICYHNFDANVTYTTI